MLPVVLGRLLPMLFAIQVAVRFAMTCLRLQVSANLTFNVIKFGNIIKLGNG